MIFISSRYKTNNIKNSYKIKLNHIHINKTKDTSIGYLKIKKIDLNEKIYNDINNDIEKHIKILEGSIEPDKENSIMFIAAHSGNTNISFFNELDKLKVEDEIELFYKNKTYIYKVISINEQDKNGSIRIQKRLENQLILTTCSPSNFNNKQLIINSIEKSL